MTAPRFYCFDIETRPLPDLVERYAKPFPPFDESAVAVGNLVDPAKIAAKRAAAAASHEVDRIAYWRNLHDRAALDPFTGAVICIGVCDETRPVEIVAEKTEAATLRQFWQLFSMSDNAVTKFIFWSGSGDPAKQFDIDFLVTRSRINRVPLPVGVRSGRYYGQRILDLAGEFLLHQRDHYLSLTKACDLFGLYEENKTLVPKRDDDLVTGANFAQWWDGAVDVAHTATEQRELACSYLRNDVNSLRALVPHILG